MSHSPYADLSRPPLSQPHLRHALVRPGALWQDVRVVRRTASTNADLVAAAGQGAPEGTVLVAEQQTAGRGRLGRAWQSPARAGLTLSILVRPATPVPERGWPALPAARYGWLPLLTGLVLTDVVRRLGEIDAGLKWPNDLLIDERKCAGILAEAVPNGPELRTNGVPAAGPAAVVVGIGLNVSLRAEELPREDATSLELSGSACVDRDPLLRAVLRGFADRYAAWRAAAGDPDRAGLRGDYLTRCATLGRQVRALLPGGGELVGAAVDVDVEGRLVVSDSGTRTAVAAGDVIHLR